MIITQPKPTGLSEQWISAKYRQSQVNSADLIDSQNLLLPKFKLKILQKPQPDGLALAFPNPGPGQSRLKAVSFGPAWPGLFWLGLA
jgi:hypothetical protein